jgi:PAS domain S-box-containing protein
MSRTQLMRELKKVQNAQRRLISNLEDKDPKQLLYELELHQIELEMQNRELQESQYRLEEARARYSDLYNFAPVGYCTLDPEGYIQEINLTGSTLLETPREQLIGKSFRSAVARATPLQFQAHMKRCIEEKARVTSDLVLVLKRGNQRTVRMISEPVMNHIGATVAYRMALIDVTEEKRFEDELRLLSNLGDVSFSSLQYSETLEAAAHVLVPAFADLLKVDLLNDDGQMERLLVLFADAGKQKALAEPLKRFSPRPGWKTAQAKAIESGEPVLLTEVPDIVRTRMAHDETHARILRAADVRSMIVVPLAIRRRTFGALTFAYAESGRRYSSSDLRLAGTIADRLAMAIDSARLFADLQRAIRARDTMLAVVSHDLRNSLNAIQLKAHVMSKSPESQHRADSAFIRRRVGEMARLIEDLLDISSIEAGRLRLEKSRQAVFPIVKEAIAAWESQAIEKSVHVRNESVGDGFIDCDPNRIQQVLNNLIGNAIKFTESGGSIHIGVETGVGEVRISVTDSGPGISDADLPHVFDRFTTASKSARRGTGLGLSIAKAIVEAHGGRIWAESRVGVGSTFYFTLPLARSESEEPTLPESAGEPDSSRAADGQPIQRNQYKKVILVVDDDADYRELLGKILEQEGYDVVMCPDGVAALEYLRNAPRLPSCILLDLTMPVMDGWTFLQERNSNQDLQSIPVVVFSGRHDVETQVIAAHASYLQKPLSPERLTAVMHEVTH